MRRCVLILGLAAAGGCSTAPVAGLLDCLAPSRARIDDRDAPDLPPRTRPPAGDPLLPPPDLPADRDSTPRFRR